MTAGRPTVLRPEESRNTHAAFLMRANPQLYFRETAWGWYEPEKPGGAQYLSQQVIVQPEVEKRPSPIHGTIIFATREMSVGERIAILGGIGVTYASGKEAYVFLNCSGGHLPTLSHPSLTRQQEALL